MTTVKEVAFESFFSHTDQYRKTTLKFEIEKVEEKMFGMCIGGGGG